MKSIELKLTCDGGREVVVAVDPTVAQVLGGAAAESFQRYADELAPQLRALSDPVLRAWELAIVLKSVGPNK